MRSIEDDWQALQQHMLNIDAEGADTDFYPIFMNWETGLTWLDRFVGNSRTKMDHTLGTWNNAAQSLSIRAYLEGDVRKRFSIKVFDSSDATPQKHGDFNDPPRVEDECEDECPKGGYRGGEFWKPEFWKIKQ